MVVSALLLCAAIGQPVPAGTLTDHPYVDSDQVDAVACVDCHADKVEGKFIHSAVSAGCDSCHQVVSEKETKKTTVTLMAGGGELCAMCHELKEGRVVHGPYRNMECIICHDPHSSEFRANTRAETNTLCLSCHGVDRPDVKVNATTQTVTLLGGQTLKIAEYRRAPKIGLDPTGRFGHPWMNHPVAERSDPLRPGEKMSCLSCHEPHTSDLPERIRPSAKNKSDICNACHQAIAQQRDEIARQKLVEQQRREAAAKTPSGGRNP